MNVINLHFSYTMILLGILASTTIIGLTSSAPLSPYDRRGLSAERPKVFLLVDQRMPGLENKIPDSGNDLGSPVKRIAKMGGSLSIVNSFDVLRERILLELARRKALQDQRQIDANRRFLESVGKRSVPEYDVSKIATNDRDYTSQRRPGSRDRSAASERVSGRTQDWFEENDPIFREPQDDRMARVQANELRLL